MSAQEEAQSRARSWVGRFKAALPYALFALLADLWCLIPWLSKTQGRLCPTLDDAFIHFQYARSFAELHPFAYHAGDVPTTGATSLLYPLLLAPLWLLGARDYAIVYAANVLAVVSFALLAWAARRTALFFVDERTSWVVAAASLLSPVFVGAAFSGMEIAVTTAAIFLAVYASLDWYFESRGDATRTPRRAALLCMLGVAAAWARPESITAACAIFLVLLLFPPRKKRVLRLISVLPIAAAFVPSLLAWLYTGDRRTTGQLVKWTFADEYLSSAQMNEKTLDRLAMLWSDALAGELAENIPIAIVSSFTRVIFALGLGAIVFHVARNKSRNGAVLIGLVMMGVTAGVVFPASYISFGNLGRYIVPFIPLIAFVSVLGAAILARYATEKSGVANLAMPAAALLIGLSFVVEPDAWRERYGQSASDICAQQVVMAERVRDLPPSAVIGLNDAGAIAYLGKHRTYDLIGLTTAFAAHPFRAGDGAVFERLERLPSDRRPTHLAYYPTWFPRLPITRESIFAAEVPGSNNLGAERKELREVRQELFRSAERPLFVRPSGRIVDRLDIADIESEASHAYRMKDRAFRRTLVLLQSSENREVADGAREYFGEESFVLRADAGHSASWVTRVVAPVGASVRVTWNGKALEAFSFEPRDGWVEWEVQIEASEVRNLNHVRRWLDEKRPFVSLHDWVFQARE